MMFLYVLEYTLEECFSDALSILSTIRIMDSTHTVLSGILHSITLFDMASFMQFVSKTDPEWKQRSHGYSPSLPVYPSPPFR